MGPSSTYRTVFGQRAALVVMAYAIASLSYAPVHLYRRLSEQGTLSIKGMGIRC
jgi:hypothetical protein